MQSDNAASSYITPNSIVLQSIRTTLQATHPFPCAGSCPNGWTEYIKTATISSPRIVTQLALFLFGHSLDTNETLHRSHYTHLSHLSYLTINYMERIKIKHIIDLRLETNTDALPLDLLGVLSKLETLVLNNNLS